MSAFSDYLEDALINHVLRNTALTSPTTVYLALFTTDPTDANSGTEVTGGSYARQAITFDAPSAGSTSNSSTMTFTDMPAATVTHWGIYDASTAGNLLLHDPWDASVTVGAGEAFVLEAGNLTISLD